MSKRQLNRRQAWRIRKVQEQRAARAQRRDTLSMAQLNQGELGPEQEGLVIAHYGSQLAVEPQADNGRYGGEPARRCHLRANLGSLVTGDRVIWRNGEATGVVVARLERSSELCRPDPYGDLKTVAANIDYIIIVVAVFPEPHANLIDRYLVAAETQHIQPIILLNKTDLLEASRHSKLEALMDSYQTLGYDVLRASAKQPHSLGLLRDVLLQQTCVFVGQSGVGKSSLINCLLPEVNTRVGSLSGVSSKGTHTTTTAQLFHLPGGGQLIDSPGIREFGLWHISRNQLLNGFIDFRPWFGQCRFRDCQHQHEPGCAIQAALRAKKISSQRWHSYQHILATLEEN